MYKLEFNNPLFAIVSVITGIILAFGLGAIPLPTIPIPFWLLVSPLVIFMITSVLIYSKGQIKDYFVASGLMFGFFVLSMLCVVLPAIFLPFLKVANLEGLILSIHPISLIVPVLTSIMATKMFVNLSYSAPLMPKPEQKPSVETSSSSVKSKIADKIEKEESELTYNPPIKEKPPEETDLPPTTEAISEIKPRVPVQEEEIFFEDLMDAPSQNVSPPQDQSLPKDEVFFEDLNKEKPLQDNNLQDKNSITNLQYTIDREVKYPENPLEKNLAPLDFEEASPNSLNLELEEENTSLEEISEENRLEESSLPEKGMLSENYAESVSNALDQAFNFDTPEESKIEFHKDTDLEQEEPLAVDENYTVPELAQDPSSKDSKSGGKITTIGRLLVDKRDIENIIDTNEQLQHISADATTTKILSQSEGDLINAKLSAIKDLSNVKGCVVVSESGFIQASNLEDLQKEQIIGALASGTYGIISNTIKKVGFKSPKEITLETNEGQLILLKALNNIFAIFIEPQPPLYQLDDINKLLVSQPTTAPEELVSSFSDIPGVIGALIASKDGHLLAHKIVDSAKNPDLLAKNLPTFYSNTGVLAKNLGLNTLQRLIIQTSSEDFLLKLVNNELIVVYSTLNTSVKALQLKQQILKLIYS